MSKEQDKSLNLRLISSYITSTVSITLVLYALGVFGILFSNAYLVGKYIRENIGFNVILDDNISTANLTRILKTLDVSKTVKETRYVNKEEAAKQLVDEMGEDFIKILGYNPADAYIEVKLKSQYADTKYINIIKNNLMKFDGVKDVFFLKNKIEKINRNIKRISIVLIFFSILLLIIAVVLINNTVRLTVYSKRFEIRTMQLIGATRTFIIKPFLVRSVLHGVISAGLAVSALGITLLILQNSLNNILYFDYILTVFILIFVAGIIITAVSSVFAVKRYLDVDLDKLYF